METLNGISHTADGRPVIAGCGTLPPDDEPPKDATANRKPKQPKQVTKDRFDVLNSFVDCSLVGLSKVDVATWLVLYRDTRNGIAVTSQADIARRAGVSDRAVRSSIGRLEKCGLLVVVRRGGLLQGPSKYRVNGTGRKRI
jgi:biotin operon repressor